VGRFHYKYNENTMKMSHKSDELKKKGGSTNRIPMSFSMK
jgi:hypothetical protein